MIKMTAIEIAQDMDLQLNTVRGYIQKVTRGNTYAGASIGVKNETASRTGKPAQYVKSEIIAIYEAAGRKYQPTKAPAKPVQAERGPKLKAKPVRKAKASK